MPGRFTTTTGTPGLKADHSQRLKTCKSGNKSVLQGSFFFFFIVITNSQEATSPGKRLQKLVLGKCFVASWMEADFLGTLNMPYL